MIDIEKFICSLLADHPAGVTVREDIHKALKDQGLEYKGGKIVSIEDKISLPESEDERIRKYLTSFVELNSGVNLPPEDAKKILGWIDKQGERKPTDKVEPKFEIEEGKRYVCTWTYTLKGKIIAIKGQIYKSNQDGAIEVEDGHLFIDKIDGKALNYFKPWTIKDAKDGDMIYVSTEEKGIQAIFYKYEGGIIYFHCNLCGDFIADGYMPIGAIEFVSPLQKVHYQRFFQKMHEAGYEWDADKKELKKIEQKHQG